MVVRRGLLLCAFTVVFGLNVADIVRAQDNLVEDITSETIRTEGSRLAKQGLEIGACSGVWARCEGIVPGANHMAVINARSVNHCLDLAKRCNQNIDRVFWFGGFSRIICTPLTVCRAR